MAFVELNSLDPFNIFRFVRLPRGIPLLAAILKIHKYKVTCYVESIQKFNWQELLDYPIIGFSVITCTAEPTYRMIQRLRRAGYKGIIIVGGPHVSALPEEALQAGADIVVRNEGDITLVEVMKALEESRDLSAVLGISYVRDGRFVHNNERPVLTEKELSQLPFPNFASIRGWENMKQIPLNFSRGCPFKCKFCAVSAMFGPDYRGSDLFCRLAQLSYIKNEMPDIWKNMSLFITDDNFFGGVEGKKVALAMLREMIARDLVPPKGWTCQMRVTEATPEVVALMKEAGCKIVYLGIESVNDDSLREIRKGYGSSQIKTGLENLQRAGIRVHAMIVAGFDTDTFSSIFKGVRLVMRWGIDTLQILALIPLPGTTLTRELVMAGRLYRVNWDKCNGNYVLVKPAKMTRFGVWASVWLIMFWYYILTPNGWRLYLRHCREFNTMIWIVIRQGASSFWRKAMSFSHRAD